MPTAIDALDGADPNQVLSRADLALAVLSARDITKAVRDGSLLRIRRDRYMSAANAGIDRAVRVGGRLACVSALLLLGVFVLDAAALHVHLPRNMSRLRSPEDSAKRLVGSRADLRLHWWTLHDIPVSLGVVGLADAVAQAVRCQTARAAVATVDSILHLELMTRAEVSDVFGTLPRRFGVILRLADASAESGPETFMRLLLRQLGLRFEAQVSIPDVGRVDFVVEGWLIIECDSRAHHEGWEKQRSDRRRDLAAARLGYTTLRPLAEDLFHHSDDVRAAVRGIVRSKRRPTRA